MKKYMQFIINTSYLFILSLCFTLIVFKHITFLSIIYILLTSIFISSVIEIITNFINNSKVRKTINIMLITPISFLFLAQLVHYYFYSCFFSFYSLTKSGQIFEFFDFILKIISAHFTNILILILLFIIYVVLTIILKNTANKNFRLYLFLIVFVPLLFIINTNIDNKGLNSSYKLITNSNNNTLNVEKFGLPVGQLIDFSRYLFGNHLMTENISKNTNSYENNLYNITDLNFRKKTDSLNIISLNNYFSTRAPSNKNEYTGIFKGKNLIFITGESFDFNVIDEDITPTLYKMREEGIYFTNHYTPIYYASTSDGEYTNLTGNLPKEGVWSYLESKDKYLPYSYGNILKNKGYKTYSYHNGRYDFYDRYLVQPNFGYDTFKACGKNLNINCSLWPQSDKEMIDATLNDYITDKNFVSYYMSISSHLSHNFKTNDMAKKWQDSVKDLKYSDSVKAYISATIDLDKAMEDLISKLEKENKLDDTVIVLVPDHFPYGLMKDELKEIQDINHSYDIHKTGLIIYNSKQKPAVINKLSSNIDILPTLLNMFNEEFDSRIIIGTDIMSDSEKIVMFNDHSFLVNEGFYDSKTNKFEGNINASKLNKLKNEVNNKFNASSILLDEDYYRYLLK